MSDNPKLQNSKQPNPPRMSDMLDEVQRGTQLSINCVQIGIIKEFDPETQLATIQIAMKQVAVAAPDGTKILQDYPLILECPVMVLYGGVSFMSMPIEPGDTCIVLFNDRSIDAWLNTGQVLAPTAPRVHDLTDAIAIVGIRPLTNSIATYLANGIRLSHAGSAKIDLTDNMITSVAQLLVHQGNMDLQGDLAITGDINQAPGKEIHAGNGATGTFNIVTVVDGIVIGGS